MCKKSTVDKMNEKEPNEDKLKKQERKSKLAKCVFFLMKRKRRDGNK